MTESIVLYVESSWSSPWVCSAFVALREKALPFTTAMTMMRSGFGAIDAMHSKTLTGTAPVLQHGSFFLAESLAIVEYLEEQFPDRRVLPAGVRDRARARQLMAWMRHHHEPLREARSSEHLVYRPREPLPPLPPAARRCADDLVRVAERLGADGRGHVFDRFGVLDSELAFALMRLIKTGFEAPAPVVAYANAVWAQPSVRAFIEHPRPPNPP